MSLTKFHTRVGKELVDDTVTEIVNGSITIKDGGITNNKLAADASRIGDFNTIEELKSFDVTSIGDNISTNVLGYYSEGDGGGGTFFWDAASTETDNGGTIIQATNVTTGRWKRVYSGAVNVKWFGAKGDGSTDDTDAIQDAIDSSAKIVFTKNDTYKIGLVKINSSCVIEGNNSSILSTVSNNTKDSGIFDVRSDLDYLHIRDFASVQFLTSHNYTDRTFLCTCDFSDKTDRKSISGGTVFNVSDLIIENNNLGVSKIVVVSSGVSTPRIIGNNWSESGTDAAEPNYVTIACSQNNILSGPAYFQNNKLKVPAGYSGIVPDGVNVDLIKITGFTDSVFVINNYIENTAPIRLGQLDVYTGSNRAIIEGNTFENVQVHRKQSGGEDISFTKIINNNFSFSATSTEKRAIYACGSLFHITGNSFKFLNSLAEDVQVIQCDKDVMVYDDFDTNGPVGIIINGNLVDIRSVGLNSMFISAESNDLGSGPITGYLNVTGNTVFGGSKFVDNTSGPSLISGNIWADYTESGTGINSQGGIARLNLTSSDVTVSDSSIYTFSDSVKTKSPRHSPMERNVQYIGEIAVNIHPSLDRPCVWLGVGQSNSVADWVWANQYMENEATLDLSISSTPTQAQVQAISDKLDAVITSLKSAKLMLPS